MIDPATGWFKMRELLDKNASTLANIVEQTWLTPYPWPQIINYDRGTKFMAEFGEMVENDYGIKRKPITKRNPQANAIIERVHQTIANIIRVHQLYNDDDVDENDPFTGILTATMFAMRATYHTTMQATPTQLVFGSSIQSLKQIGHTFVNVSNKS
jgi:transposase InsO family protein